MRRANVATSPFWSTPTRRISRASLTSRGSPIGLEPGLPQRAAGGDHVGHRVGHPEADGVLHRTVEPDHGGGEPGVSSQACSSPG